MNLARTWTNLAPHKKILVDRPNLMQFIPPNDPAGIEVEFVIDNPGFRAEHVALTVNALVQKRGNLAISLVSPSGIVSHMAHSREDNGPDYRNFIFMTLFNWGESPSGAWKLRIHDAGVFPPSGPATTLRNAQLTVYGTESVVAPVVRSARREANSFRLVVLGTVGKAYELQSSSDFTNWSMVTAITAPTAEFELTDANIVGTTKFYRVSVK